MVGVDALPNRPDGSVAGVALGGQAIAAAMALSGTVALHPAQLSVTRPGYPRPSERESEAAFGYRLRRDAAHVDWLMAEGPDKRRFLREPHAWILGIALTTADADAAPLTDLRRGALDDLLTSLDDTTPDRRAWDEAIAEARRYG